MMLGPHLLLGMHLNISLICEYFSQRLEDIVDDFHESNVHIFDALSMLQFEDLYTSDMEVDHNSNT